MALRELAVCVGPWDSLAAGPCFTSLLAGSMVGAGWGRRGALPMAGETGRT